MASAPVRILVRASGASIDVPAGVVVTAGRGSQCEIHLDDQSGCRRHCSLEIASGQCIVRDYSRFGTFLNGHRLEGSAVLEPGDTIRVGTPGFELRLITVEQDHGA